MPIASITSATPVVPYQSSPTHVGSDTFEHAHHSMAVGSGAREHAIASRPAMKLEKRKGGRGGGGGRGSGGAGSVTRPRLYGSGNSIASSKKRCTETLEEEGNPGAQYIGSNYADPVCKEWKILSLTNCDVVGSLPKEDVWQGIKQPKTFDVVSNSRPFANGGVASRGPTTEDTQNCIADAYGEAVDKYLSSSAYIGTVAGVTIGTIAAAVSLVMGANWLRAQLGGATSRSHNINMQNLGQEDSSV